MRVTFKKVAVVLAVLAGLFVLGIVAIALSAQPLMKRFLIRSVEQQTGLEATVEEFAFRPWSGEVRIGGLKLFQPATNGGALVLDLPEVFVSLDTAAREGGALKFRELRLNIAEANISADLADPARWEHLTREQPSLGTNGLETVFGGIDRLTLTIGTLRFPDPNQPDRMLDVPVNIRSQVFTNLTSTNIEEVVYFIGIKAGAGMLFDTGRGLF